MNVLVIIPTYNEKENITRLIKHILGNNYEIDVLVVDDNSPDGTSEEIIDNFKNNSRVSLLTRDKKDGRGGAVLDGISEAIKKGFYNRVIEMDADFSHDPDELPLILEKSKEVDVVIGSRYLPDSSIVGWPFQRAVFSKIANFYARFLLKIPISDYTNGYRCYSIESAKSIEKDKIKSKGYIVLSEIAYQLFLKGFSFGEVPTRFVNRTRGISNLSINEIISAFTSVWKLKFGK